MKKGKTSKWEAALQMVGYIIIAWFTGAIFLSIVEGLGDWITHKHLTAPQWDALALVAGAILVWAWKQLPKLAAQQDEDESK